MSDLDLSASTYYRRMVKLMQLLPRFNRVQLAAILGVPFGTISGRMVALENAGYIMKIARTDTIRLSDLARNPDFEDWMLNCTGDTSVSTDEYSVTITFKSEFLPIWAEFARNNPWEPGDEVGELEDKVRKLTNANNKLKKAQAEAAKNATSAKGTA